MDLKRYYRLHPDGLCRVEVDPVKDKPHFIVLFKRFDNETGVELSPEPHYVTKEGLEKDKQDLLIQLDAVNSILGDIEKL